MRIVGHGIDIVEISRIAAMIDRHGEHFLARVFTPAERAYAASNPRRQTEHLAARFAAKEAVLKVLGTGWSGGIAWTDVEVIRQPSGQPTVRLHHRTAAIAYNLGIREWFLSLSHTPAHAIASALGVSTPDPM